MCDTETKQTYAVLRAFSEVNGHLYEEEVKQKLAEILDPIGASSIESLGPLTFDEIVDDLLRARVTKIDRNRKRTFDRSPETLHTLNVLEGLVREAEPALTPQLD